MIYDFKKLKAHPTCHASFSKVTSHNLTKIVPPAWEPSIPTSEPMQEILTQTILFQIKIHDLKENGGYTIKQYFLIHLNKITKKYMQ